MIRFLQTPGRAKKIVIGSLLTLICAAMVITLIPGGFLGDSFGFNRGGLDPNVLAKVGDQQVTVLETQREARNMGQQQFGGRNMPEQLMPYLIQRAADRLIMQKAVLSEAGRMGLSVSDAELQDELQHGRYSQTFFPNGKFIGQQAYEGMLQEANLTPTQFENGVKDELLMRKLEALITGPVAVSNSDIERQFNKENTKVKFEYAVLSTDQIKKGIQPTEAELKAYHDRNKQMYANSIPEKRKVRYILIDSSKVASQVQVSPSDIQRYYSDHQDDYRSPEQVNVRHILIKTPTPAPDGKIDEKAVNAAKQKAEDIAKQLKAGADFAALAKKYSEDTVSAKNGGSLGWIGKGRTVPEFEHAAFGLAKGGTSEVVRSSYGFHIIRVDDKQDARLKPLSEVKAQIEPVLAQQKASQAAQNLADRVQNQARTAGLDKAAAQNGEQVITTGFIGRTDSLPGLGNAPEFMNAVFEASDKNPPEEANLRTGYVIFQVAQVQPPRTPSFEEIRSKVETDFVSERAATLLSQQVQGLSDRARTLHDLKKAAKELGATVKTSELVSPTSQVPDIGSMQSGQANLAFSMKPGDVSGPIQNGNTGVVLRILEKQEPSAAEFARAKDQTRDKVADEKRGELFELFVTNLRQDMEKHGKIRVNEQVMKQLSTPRGELGG
ncbi:MAG TPA: peptidyl-prolyl cis-trans isomerase [Terriglobales bacterium]|nr:peptidyl-prolyl cis-trans isomerase [Terriglobales bacterium]